MPRNARKLAVFAASTALALGGVAMASTTAVGADQVTDTQMQIKTHPVIGSWSGTVQHQGGSGSIQLGFLSSGALCLHSGGDGHGTGVGTGTWKSTGASTFTFAVREHLSDNDGNPTGFVDVSQSGKVVGNTLNSSGVSKIYDVNGNFITTANATITATRV